MNEAHELLRRMIGYLDYSNKEADAFSVEVEAFLDNQETAKDEPIAVIDDNSGSRQIFKDIAPHAHVIDIHVRYGGTWYFFEGDWIKEALPKIVFNQIDNRGIKSTLKVHKEAHAAYLKAKAELHKF